MGDYETGYQYQDAYGGSALLKDSDMNPRLGFVRKVYAIIFCQLLVTFGLTAYAMATVEKGGLGWYMNSPQGKPILWVMMAVYIITMIMVFCCQSVARTVPTNYITLFIFTLSLSWLVASVCAMFSQAQLQGLVYEAAAMTAAMTFGLTLYACTTKNDITYTGAALFIFSVGFLLMAIFGIFFVRVKWFYTLMVVGIIILYGFYLVYDTQLIIGGGSYQLSIDDYILGAMLIYIDIIILFLRILQLLAIIAGKK